MNAGSESRMSLRSAIDAVTLMSSDGLANTATVSDTIDAPLLLADSPDEIMTIIITKFHVRNLAYSDTSQGRRSHRSWGS